MNLQVLVRLASICIAVTVFANCGFAQETSHWKIRAGFVGLSNDFSMLDGMERSRMNSVVVSYGGHLVDFAAPERAKLQTTLGNTQREALTRWQRETERRGLRYFPLIELYGTGDRKRWKLDRHYVDVTGRHHPNTPCPMDASFWRDKIGRYCLELARWSAGHANVAGILIDAEMYGADRVAFPDACFCPECFQEISAASPTIQSLPGPDDPKAMAAWRRESTVITRRILERIRRQVQEANPNCRLGGLVLDHVSPDGFTPPFYKAITQAWGTEDQPVLIFSEATYQPGYHAAFARPSRPLVRPTGSDVNGKPSPFGQGDHPGYIQEWTQRWKQWNAHAEFVGGLWIDRIPDENLAENLFHFGRHTRGYWIYDMIQMGSQPRGRLPGEGAIAYWKAIGKANRELDQLRAEGDRYQSKLRMRPFTLPAPGLSLDLWRSANNLAKGGTPMGSSELLFHGTHAMVYIPASEGETVKLAIVADSAHATKKKHDAVAIAVLDPEGQIIQRDKLTTEDLDQEQRADGRWGGSRQVIFHANASGTYCVALKGLRYAYGPGKSSHAWLASIHHPTTLFRPQRLFVRSTGKRDTLRLRLNTRVSATVRDPDGDKLDARVEPMENGQADLVISMVEAKSRTLEITFDRLPWQLQIRSIDGLHPWLATSANASFPD